MRIEFCNEAATALPGDGKLWLTEAVALMDFCEALMEAEKEGG